MGNHYAVSRARSHLQASAPQPLSAAAAAAAAAAAQPRRHLHQPLLRLRRRSPLLLLCVAAPPPPPPPLLRRAAVGTACLRHCRRWRRQLCRLTSLNCLFAGTACLWRRANGPWSRRRCKCRCRRRLCGGICAGTACLWLRRHRSRQRRRRYWCSRCQNFEPFAGDLLGGIFVLCISKLSLAGILENFGCKHFYTESCPSTWL